MSGRPPAGDGGAIFFLTDYGQEDELAGVVRAVLAAMAPGATVVDLTHGIPAFDVRAGALALERAVPHLGPGVVLAVVDPGVGTARRAVALEVAPPDGPRALVGPDNGLLVPAARALGGVRAGAVLPAAGGEGRATFDGRDVFAPAAAALWRGVPLSEIGTPFEVSGLVALAAPRLEVGDGGVVAEVLWVDRFGNVQLSAGAGDGRAAGLVAGSPVGIEAPDSGFAGSGVVVRAFDDVAATPDAQLGVLVDANGRLAVVAARRSAATVLGVGPGDTVIVRRSRTAAASGTHRPMGER
ncbi:MAG TPA: SAM-dependent chlorinase/fluorinase [Acidimicrobiales bacterium]|nr:SAM-dependent chlorinase/fluorinase [Acidimicrobiales bacterium]